MSESSQSTWHQDKSDAKKLENLVVARPAGALDALMAEQVEVSLSGMVDA